MKCESHEHIADWVYPAPESGTTSDAAMGGGRLRYRVVGSRVFVSGGVTLAVTGEKRLFTLPEGARPSMASRFFLRPSTSGTVAMLYVNTQGHVVIQYARSLSDGAPHTGGIWVDCNIEFWTD